MDQILWKFGQFYHKHFCQENPEHSDVSVGVITMSFLLALEAEGHATKHVDPNGDVTWTATARFMAGKKSESGPLISLGPYLQ